MSTAFLDSETAAGPEARDGAAGHRDAVFGRFATLVRRGSLDLEPPGGGRTRARWARLTAVAEEDLALARLAEGHTDALAILHEIGAREVSERPPDGEYWGVWAAEPPGSGLSAARVGGHWTLKGRKAFCSGARLCTRALVTARSGTQSRLFAVDCAAAGLHLVPDSWPAAAMAASDTLDIDFDDVPAEPVGAPGAYLDRPGFQHGGIGVAACWYGGARAIARTLHTAARSYDVGPHALAHLGAVSAGLRSVSALLDVAAAEIDADPDDLAGGAAVRSKQVRAATEGACGEVIARVGRALGASPLAHDAEHARRVADLTLYLRQHHAERDYATLGRQLAELEWAEVAK